MTFLRNASGPFKTVRNFTKKPLNRRRSLQPVKLPDGKEDPKAKTTLTQDGEQGEVASRNIAWTAVFAPPVPTTVCFTIVHSGEYGKGAQEGMRVEEFSTCTYTFTTENNTFDIDIEVLASKETALLKKRPSGLSILARAQKLDSGELLGDSPPVSIQGPNRRGSAEGTCTTPSPTLAFPPYNAHSSSLLSLLTPEDDRTVALTPSSHEHRVPVKPTPNRVAPGFPLRPDLEGYGLAAGGPSGLFSPVPIRANSPGTILAGDMQELCLRPAEPVQPVVQQLHQQMFFQQDLKFTNEDLDGRQNSTVQSHPWMSPMMSSRGLVAMGIQDSLQLEPPMMGAVAHSENEEALGGTAIRKRPSCFSNMDMLEQTQQAGQPDASCIKARKLHSGDKDFSGLTSDEDFAWASQPQAAVCQGPQAFLNSGGEEEQFMGSEREEIFSLPDLFITEGSLPATGLPLVKSQSSKMLCELEAAEAEEARAERSQSTPSGGSANEHEQFVFGPRMSVDGAEELQFSINS